MERIKLEATNEQTPPERLRELAKINSTLAGLVANNPNATPELLTELANSEEDFIRKNVAANPNTPKEVLWKLGEEFPQEVLDNGVFPLLLLENPNLIDEIPDDTLTSFLKCSTVPISFMEWAVKTRGWKAVKLYLSMTMNSQTPRTLLEKLLRDKKETVTDAVVNAVKLHVNYAGELEGDVQEELPRSIERGTVSSGQLFCSGNEIGFRYFFPLLAAIDLVPEFILEMLARHEKRDVRYLAALNILPLNLLFELGQDREPKVRAMVAKNSIAPPELLELLAKDKDAKVRSGVASNSNAPPKVLEELATDRQREVREKVAKNPNSPATLLEKLVSDKRLFLAVASNPNTPKTAIEKLALYKLGQHQKLMMILAANPNTPVYILENLERTKEGVCGDRLAGNPATPKYLLEKFARSKKDWTRKALASNPKIPIDVLEQLCHDRSFVVRRAVATNPKAPFSILEEGLLELLEYEQADANTLLRYLREKPEGLSALLELIFEKSLGLTRTIALWHPQMPAKVLAENVRSLNWLERCAIAQNHNTSKETLQLLAADGNRIVRAAAKENLKSQ